MSFKTLEQRYKEKVGELYDGAKSKFDGGRPSSGFNDDPLNVRAPGDESFGRISQALGRFLPVARAFQDVIRLTKFTASMRGIIFLGKQALLQTGNTFEATRIINPLFTIANAVPFLHIRRHLTPGNLISADLIKRTNASTADVKSMGQLQVTTYAKLMGQAPPNPYTSLFRAVKTVGWESNTTPYNVNALWEISRPELVVPENPIKSVFSQRKVINEAINSGSIPNEPAFSTPSPTYSGQSNTVYKFASDPSVKHIRVVRPKKKYYADESNNRLTFKEASTVARNFPYNSFKDKFPDYIMVSFSMGNQPAVQFRAYVRDLSQTVTPQHKDFQYVGRTEKFITYSGTQRDVGFKLTVLAERKEELSEVWKRINYLTGLAFPYGVASGLYQPNIIKMTIGNMFIDQPMYITGLTTNFAEVIESWDLENEIPMGATIDLKCVLIEKRQRVSNSPFYGITEKTFSQEYKDSFRDGFLPKGEAPGVYTDANITDGDYTAAFQSIGNRAAPFTVIDVDVPDVPEINIEPPPITFTGGPVYRP